jgi:hypothetical protein
MKTFEQHPLSSAFPPMSPEAFKDLIDDIDQNGVREKIVVYEGKILDGWHRYSACLELNVLKPPMVEFEGDNPKVFVLSKNLHRRHMTPSERAMAVATIIGSDGWESGTGGRPSKAILKERGNKINTVSRAADLADVSRRVMKGAKKATLAIDKVQQAVKDGKMSVFEAADISSLPVEDQMAAVKSKDEPRQRRETPKKTSVPVDVYDALLVSFNELQDHCQTLTSELKTAQLELQAVDAIRSGEQVKEMMKLHQLIRSMTEARNQWQDKCNEMTKQLNYLTKKK